VVPARPRRGSLFPLFPIGQKDGIRGLLLRALRGLRHRYNCFGSGVTSLCVAKSAGAETFLVQFKPVACWGSAYRAVPLRAGYEEHGWRLFRSAHALATSKGSLRDVTSQSRPSFVGLLLLVSPWRPRHAYVDGMRAACDEVSHFLRKKKKRCRVRRAGCSWATCVKLGQG
jgi:hypothetical protein